MEQTSRHILVVGGGTSGAVLAARLSENPDVAVTLLEAGPDHDGYEATNIEPISASDTWGGVGTNIVTTAMKTEAGAITAIQGRLLGGTSAINGLATLRGQPADYDAWAAAGCGGWGWTDVVDTFIAAETDRDFHNSPLHGSKGPLPVRRWRREELDPGHAAFHDAMAEIGQPVATDINDPDQLPGVGIFPVTIDDQARRVSTSLAYLTDDVRARDNLTIRTRAPVATIAIEAGRAHGVTLQSGEEITADEVVLTAGALYSPTILLRSGVGPKDHLSDYGIHVHADLPVGSTMSDHLGTAVLYHCKGARSGIAGPAQVVCVGASNGTDVDYHLMPISIHNPEKDPLTFSEKRRFFGQFKNDGASPGLGTMLSVLKFLLTPTTNSTLFTVAALSLCSSGKGSVRLGETPDAAPKVVAPPLDDKVRQSLRHAFDRLADWEESDAFKANNIQSVLGQNLRAADAVETSLQRNTISYFHMVGTCPMGTVLDADCRVHGIANLRVADGSVMPQIPRGNTYLGCVMVAERIARKMLGDASSSASGDISAARTGHG